MKLIITTLTGDKHELEVAPHDTVRKLKKLLYQSGKVTSQVRLFQGQTVLEDDRKLCEYSLPEGAMISALFEPDVDINVEVKTIPQVNKLTVSNGTSVRGLKTQISGVMSCGVPPQRLDIRLGDITLEDPIPLHFYGIRNGTKLDVLKPYVNVKILNNRGAAIYWRLDRKDAIKEVKVKLAAAQSLVPIRFYLYYGFLHDYGTSQAPIADQSFFNEIRGIQEGVSAAGMRLYIINDDGEKFEELADDETVDNCNIKDGDNLFLLTYRWLHHEGDVAVLKTKSKIEGVEPDETSLGIKVKVQDQIGLPASSLTLLRGSSLDITEYSSLGSSIQDTDKPLMSKEKASLVVATMEELRAEHFRRQEERKAQEAKREEEAERQKALNEKMQREYLEAEAAKAGLTMEEYLAWLETQQYRR